MSDQLEIRLKELQDILEELSPKTASQSTSIDYIQMQTYILGFKDASRIIYSLLSKGKGCIEALTEPA